jgi:hypothetical protein
MHLCVVPICLPLTADRIMNERPTNVTHRTPKKTVMIRLLQYTAFTRKKNMAEDDGNVTTRQPPIAYMSALQLATGEAMKISKYR